LRRREAAKESRAALAPCESLVNLGMRHETDWVIV
jgi:hypothetical protein